MGNKRRITREDILSMEDYGAIRKDRRRALVQRKRNRRMAVGPFVTLHFENYDTMWHQVHEMLFIEKGGEAQIAGELEAYNPLIPQGRELVATMLLEIEDPVRRARTLATLGGIDETVTFTIGGDIVRGLPEQDVERTTEDGKTSSVHFLRFPFTDAQAEAFRQPNAQVVLGVGHPNYGHMAVVPDAVRQALAEDLD